MTTTRRINLLFVCCLVILLLGIFGLPGAIVSAVFHPVPPTYSDFVDYGAFLANGIVAVGALALWVIGSQRIRHPKRSRRSNGYQTVPEPTTPEGSSSSDLS